MMDLSSPSLEPEFTRTPPQAPFSTGFALFAAPSSYPAGPVQFSTGLAQSLSSPPPSSESDQAPQKPQEIEGDPNGEKRVQRIAFRPDELFFSQK